MSTGTDAGVRIQQLSQSVINKIAAGEVIERPASVVKELLENSVDALATRIDVEVEQGGAELLRIVDNGEGIHPDDILLAVASHATSKIRDADDLFSVQTMGFRGEALASIAEVSKFRIRSRQADQTTGVELEVDGGSIKPARPCGCPVGTQMDVRQLFFNTPVRRKFLKSQSTEFAHISEQFTRIALANPNLQMTLRHNGKQVYDLPATHNHLERLELFFGSELARQLIPVQGEFQGVKLWGYVGHPSLSKSTRKGQYLFLNGRWIQDRSLQHALTEAFRGLLMVGRQPIAFLFLELAPEQVDVNVHPTKSEVRFQDSQTLYRLVLSSLRSKFLSMNLDSNLEAGRLLRGSDTTDNEEPQDDLHRRVQQELVSWTQRQFPDHTEQNAEHEPRSYTEPTLFPAAKTKPNTDPLAEYADDLFTANEPATADIASAPPVSAAAPATVVHVDEPTAARYPASGSTTLRAMQVHDCYLVVETEQGITVIDQHALHERIMYENLRKRILNGKVEIQRLLIPVTVELSARECGLLLDQEELLKDLGLVVESFGGSTLVLTGFPTMLKRADPVKLLRDIADMLETSGSKVTRRDLIDSMLHMMACKAAIKAGQRLTPEEIEALLEQRHLCDDHHHCPHGRPTALTLSRVELDRQFGRLG